MQDGPDLMMPVVKSGSGIPGRASGCGAGDRLLARVPGRASYQGRVVASQGKECSPNVHAAVKLGWKKSARSTMRCG